MQKSGKCQTIFFRIFSKYKKLILDNLHLIWYINHVAEIQQDATIAQVVERIIGNDEVTGPTPVSSLFLCSALQKEVRLYMQVYLLMYKTNFFFIGWNTHTAPNHSGNEVAVQALAFRDNRAERRGALRHSVLNFFRIL